MAIGPGKYDYICTMAREAAQAQAAMVIIFDGTQGSGFSIQCVRPMHPSEIARTLEDTARQIRESMKGQPQ
jgi:hypothetical protein